MRCCASTHVSNATRASLIAVFPSLAGHQRALFSHTPAQAAPAHAGTKRRGVKRAVSPSAPTTTATSTSASTRVNTELGDLLSALRQRAAAPTPPEAATPMIATSTRSLRQSRAAHTPAHANSRARPPRARREQHELPGGDLRDAVVPSPLVLLQADKVCADVQRVIAEETSSPPTSRTARVQSTASVRPAMRVLHVPHSTLKRAVLTFTPAPGSPAVTAIGQSTKEKVARKLCWLHAAALIDHFTLHRDADATFSSPSLTAPLPPPLVSEPVKGGARTTTTTMDKLPAHAASVPRPEQYTDWPAYVRAASAYVTRQSEGTRVACLQRGEVPLSGNPFVDRAAARLTERTKPLPKLLVQRLNNAMHDASRAIGVTPLGRDLFVASLPLDTASGLVATGAARSSKSAKQRCAAHAIYILQELQKANQPVSALSADGGTGVVRSAPLPSLVESLRPRQGRLFAFFEYLYLRDTSLTPPVVFETRFSKNKADQFVCTVQIGDVRCEGTGLNSFESERAATEAALAEMELFDPRVQHIGRFIDRYPRADAHALARVSLSASLRERMARELAQYEVALGAPLDGASHTSSAITHKKDGTVLPPTVAGGEDVLPAFQADASLGAAEGEAALGLSSPPNTAYAAQLREQLCRLRANPTYLRAFHPRRTTLAMARVRDALLHALDTHRVVLVCGTTGCGKTTQVPQYILDAAIMRGEGDRCHILVTQPRRLTTFGVADRIAKERLEEVGQTVGYAVRLDAKPGRHVTLCTTGVLLQMLVSSPNLAHCSHLILDEVHERDLNCDVTLALVKSLLQTNPNLKVILMSATMQHELFVNYFRTSTSQETIPVIHVEGQVYPVKEMFLGDIAAACQGGRATHSATSLAPFSSRMFALVAEEERAADGSSGSRHRSRPRHLHTPPPTDYQLIAHLVHRSVAHDMHGDPTGKSILVFLPGWKELVAAKRAIEDYGASAASRQTTTGTAIRPHIILLHSTIDGAKQKECFLPAPAGTVKVVLATNIAESGITIDDVAVVIDTGLLKLTTWTAVRGGENGQQRSGGGDGFGLDAASAATSSAFGTQLSLCYASRANCTQRKGRAGRTQGGVCYRLYTRATYDAMEAFQAAEIHRVSLAQVVLKLLSLGHLRPRDTLRQFLEAPSPANVEVSMSLLKSLGAIDAQEALTALGRYLARLPCDPRVGKMIVMGAVLQCLDSVLTVAAASDATPFVNSRLVATEVHQQRFHFARGSQSDHISALNAYNAYCRQEELAMTPAAYGTQSDGASHFANTHYLNLTNMRLISRYKLQYREILAQAGLLAGAAAAEDAEMTEAGERRSGDAPAWLAPARHRRRRRGELFVDESPLSDKATHVAVVKACVCAALFPNVAVRDIPPDAHRRQNRVQAQAAKLLLRTKAHTSITPSKESVCRRVGAPREHGLPSREELIQGLLPLPLPPAATVSDGTHGASDARAEVQAEVGSPATYYLYQDIFSVREARKDFLTNVTAVSFWALLLFGAGEANVSYDEAVGVCVVDDWIFVSMRPEDFAVLQQLKRLLLASVWRLYERPHDRDGRAALRGLRALSDAVLAAPLEAADDEKAIEQSARQSHRATDSGAIVSPFVEDAPSVGKEVNPLEVNRGTAHVDVSCADDDEEEEEDIFGVFIDEDD